MVNCSAWKHIWWFQLKTLCTSDSSAVDSRVYFINNNNRTHRLTSHFIFSLRPSCKFSIVFVLCRTVNLFDKNQLCSIQPIQLCARLTLMNYRVKYACSSCKNWQNISYESLEFDGARRVWMSCVFFFFLSFLFHQRSILLIAALNEQPKHFDKEYIYVATRRVR